MNEKKGSGDMLAFPEKIKTPLKSFAEEIKNCSETIFLELLILHLCVIFEKKINWSVNKNMMKVFGTILLLGTMFGCACFLIYIIICWKQPWKTKSFFLSSAVGLLLLFLIFNLKGDKNWYLALTDFFFCMLAYGKNYKKILRCYM